MVENLDIWMICKEMTSCVGMAIKKIIFIAFVYAISNFL